MTDLTYAIGDIHGCEEQLCAMIDLIADHAGDRPRRFVLLGDYIDRGPNSKGVLDILIAYPEFITLRGNHEQMLLDAYDTMGPGECLDFLANGGDATLRSFGVNRIADIPQKYIDFIRHKTRMYYEDDLRVFVHAGIDPNQPDMTKQRDQVLLWIRRDFHVLDFLFFKYVVHGHTPQIGGKPDIRHNRCNLDTLCYGGKPLTCGVFDDTQAAPVDILQVKHD